jgi:hypothetical protein
MPIDGATPTWEDKKKQINDAILRLEAAMAALKAAQLALNEVVSSDPGGGPNIQD